MELTDPRMIAALMEEAQRPKRKPNRRREAGPDNLETSAKPIPKVRRCRCGTCRTCLEEARWNRIFNEKFADPTYYNTRLVRFDSPLAF